VFTIDQLQLIKKAGIEFEELSPQLLREPEARRVSGARRR
jgi:hypothetical protein